MRSNWLKLFILALLITIKEPVMAEDFEVSDATRSAIATLIANEDDAWNRGDAEAFAARALPNIVFTNILGMFSVGRVPFVERHARIFSTVFKGSTNHQQIQHITLIKSDVAVVDTLAVLTGSQQGPPGIQLIDGTLHTRLEQVLVQRADGWWIVSFHNVAVSPMGAQPPKL